MNARIQHWQHGVLIMLNVVIYQRIFSANARTALPAMVKCIARMSMSANSPVHAAIMPIVLIVLAILRAIAGKDLRVIHTKG